jgi:hypothetical protein
VYRLRAFRNSDPPHLAAIWRSQPPQRGVLQPISPPLLEYAVFSKLNFDRCGLIVATRDDVPVGFVHAGFGPTDDGLHLDTSLGVTQMLMVQGGSEAEAPRSSTPVESTRSTRSTSASTAGAKSPASCRPTKFSAPPPNEPTTASSTAC